jgi:hypothetical protein
MTTATTPTLAEVFARLRQIGISQAFAKKMLPSWWDDKIALTVYSKRSFTLVVRSI